MPQFQIGDVVEIHATVTGVDEDGDVWLECHGAAFCLNPCRIVRVVSRPVKVGSLVSYEAISGRRLTGTVRGLYEGLAWVALTNGSFATVDLKELTVDD